MTRIRPASPQDADSLHLLRQQVFAESDFLLPQPEEYQATPEQVRQELENQAKSHDSVILVAEVEGRLVGFLGAMSRPLRKIRHCVLVHIGILEDFTGQGLGKQLFEALEIWATAAGKTRLELTVATHNQRAVALYRKLGFQTEGLKRGSLRIRDCWVDEFLMAKLLPGGPGPAAS